MWRDPCRSTTRIPWWWSCRRCAQALARLDHITDLTALDTWRIDYLGRRGALTQVMRGIGKLSPEQRPLVGQVSNEVKTTLEEGFEARVTALKQAQFASALAQQRIDVTLPGVPVSLGRVHPSTQTLREIAAIFSDMGFQIFDSREVESDLYNFELLNMPPYHPARDMWDTFYINERVVLRTHTSPGQIRAMQAYHPEPIRVILPGMCYRYEAITARSEIMFHQVEGLAVGTNITMADLKGVLVNFARRMFGEDRQVRFRCNHFPFTEPSVELIWTASFVAARAVRSASTVGGWRFLEPVWSIPRCSVMAAMTPRCLAGLPSAWGLSVLPC